MGSNIYIGDTGTELNFSAYSSDGTALTITGALNTTLYMKKPNESISSLSPTISAESTWTYTITTTGVDFNLAGDYYFQIQTTIGNWTGRSDTTHLIVRNYFD